MIEYLHASKFGNGAVVAAHFASAMAAKGIAVEVHHITEVSPTALAPAELYVFSSPGRMGRPIRAMRHFLQNLSLPAGTRYAVLTTEAAPAPDRGTGRVPTEAARARHQRVRPIMHEQLDRKGLVSVGDGVVYVTGLKGPLEAGWQDKVDDLAAHLIGSVAGLS